MKIKTMLSVICMSALFVSCNVSISLDSIKGDKNVVTKERPVSADFTVVRGSSGLDVFLTQGTENKIVVEADENLHEHITTNIEGGKLHVKSEKNIRSAAAKKVYVTYISLEGIEASSGADVKTTNQLKTENLYLKSSSGADLVADVYAKELSLDSSSGSDLKVSGSAKNVEAESSSGSDINAKSLVALNGKARASSGSDVTIHVTNSLDAKASSGGDIRYYGNPTDVMKNKSTSGGGVKKMD